MAAGPVGEVLAASATGDLRVRVPDPPAARAVLEAAGWTVTSTRERSDALLVSGAPHPSDVTRVLAGAGHYLSELTPVSADLESVFLSLTADGLPPHGHPLPPAPSGSLVEEPRGAPPPSPRPPRSALAAPRCWPPRCTG